VLRAACLASLLLVLGLAPVDAADLRKTVRAVFPVAETGFDPQAISDLYSAEVMRGIFEPLYEYEYLARPYRLAPLVAEALPEISPDGKHWTIRLRKGVRFADDPAFGGKPRELVAADFVYAWKRLLDPKVRSPYLWFVDGYLVGADALVDAAKRTGSFDYDRPLEGLRAVDSHTIELRLTRPNYVLVEHMTHTAMAPVAREVIAAHGDAATHAMAHPVGTGPYRLAQWRRGQKIVLEANPGFREEYFPDSTDPADSAIVATMKGKRLPRIGRVEIGVIEESNPRLLAFDSKALDYVSLPSDLAPRVLDTDGRLKPQYADQGVRLHRLVQPALAYTYFNMEDPVVGGYTPERIALRRAIVMGYDIREDIRVLWHGQAMPATQPIPPGLIGHEPGFNGRPDYDPELARALLERFGYRDRDGDGYREQPDGTPLRIVKASSPTARERELDELWKRSMDSLGIRLEFLKQKWPDLLKMGKAGQLQMWGVGWIAGSPDGDAFLQLLYGRNIEQSNYSRFRLEEYDRLYEQARLLANGPRRAELYRLMSETAAVYTPWDFGLYRYESTLVWPWLQGYKKHAFRHQPWKYWDIDGAQSRSPPGEARAAAARP
jgi:ABC-type transport system substrate-binding protein